MDGRTRVLLYHRLARDDSMAMECQNHYLRSWAAENGCTVIDEIAEVGSGLRLDRPGLSAVIQAVREKRMAALVVRKLDRLPRNPLEAYGLMEMLKAQGIDFICTDEIFVPDLFVTRF